MASFEELNTVRKEGYKKDKQEENFLQSMNESLQKAETAHYKDYGINHPFLFIFGLPRSGTTLISQLIAYFFDIGYINNLVSRFWLAPLHGIKLSKSVLGESKKSDFQSDYARTQNITDIHEFGYFWRYWLNKDTMEDITKVYEREKDIDWNSIRKVLSTLQKEFDKPMVFKNIYGSYHLKKFQEILGKVIYIFIERDELDSAVSILDARRKYYTDLNTWWSYTPVEYDELKNLPYMEQIAGQVYYLKKFYNEQIKSLEKPSVVRVDYEKLCKDPLGVLNDINEKSIEIYDYGLNIEQTPPESFNFRTYTDRQKEKDEFAELIEKFREKDTP